TDYRSFMIARVLLAFVSIADPFYVVYAKVALGAPLATVGLYLAASAISALLSNFIWGPLTDRVSSRTLMVLTVLSVATVPLAALVIPLFQPVVPADVFDTLFAVVFVFGGLATGSARIVNNNMLLSIAPPAERPAYLGFLNTV